MTNSKVFQALVALGVIGAPSLMAQDASEHVMTAVSGTQISGYVSTSAIWKFGTGTPIPFRAYDGTAKQDGFNLDVVNLTVSKPLDESEWSAGYKAELLFGPDAAAIGTSSIAGGNGEDFNIKQAYVALRAPVGNGLDFKVGVWDTIIGYEVFNAGDNPNYSRSFGYTLEPTTYTGIQASYRVADCLAFVAGVANAGVAATINNRPFGVDESEKNYMAGFTLSAPDSWGALAGSSLSAGVIDHSTGAGPSDVINWYVGFTLSTGVEGLKVGAAYDYQGRDGAPGFGAFYANAISGYFSYQATEKLGFHLRGEYASGSSGIPGGGAPFASAGKFAAGSNTELFGVTATVDYSLWDNVLSRVELRWDSDVSGGPNLYGTPADPDKNAISIALNVIYKF